MCVGQTECRPIRFSLLDLCVDCAGFASASTVYSLQSLKIKVSGLALARQGQSMKEQFYIKVENICDVCQNYSQDDDREEVR